MKTLLNKIKRIFCIHDEEPFFTSKGEVEYYICSKCGKHFRYPGEEDILISKKYITLQVWKTNLPQVSVSCIIYLWCFEFAISFYIFCIRLTIGD